MNNAFDPDEFNIDDLDPDIGETIIEGSWFFDNTGAPVSWGGTNRIADLGDGRWILIQLGDDEASVEIAPAPSPGPEAASKIAAFFADRYERAIALEFEEFDPSNTLDPAIQKRLQDAIRDSTDESRTGRVEVVLSSLDSATRAALKEEFRSWKGTYYDSWRALSEPAEESSADLFIDLLSDQGVETTWEDLMDIDSAVAHAIDREHEGDDGPASDADPVGPADSTYDIASDPETPVDQLLEIALRTRSPKVLEALQENPSITDAVLTEWAGSGRRRLVDLVLEEFKPPVAALELIASSATPSQAEYLLNFVANDAVLAHLVQSEDEEVLDLISNWKISPHSSSGSISAIAWTQKALKDRREKEGR